MPLSLSTANSIPRLPRLLACALVATLALPATAQDTDPIADALERSWTALREGTPGDTVDRTASLIEHAADLDEQPAWIDEAYLAHAAGLYALGRTREAANAARSVSDLGGALEDADDDALPTGFAVWVRAAATANGEQPLGPEIALEELNPDREIHAVASHFELDVEIVRIPVIVEDKAGDFVTDLEAEQFTVEDGGPPAQPIYQLIREDEPSSVGILIDASDAARAETPALMQAVMELIGEMRPDDEVFLLQFADDTRFLSDFAPGGEDLLPALAAYDPGGGRAVRDALATGLIRMRQAAHDKKSLVLIALGDDAGSDTTSRDVRGAAQRDGVSIHTIVTPIGLDRWRPGQSDDAPTHLLQRLAFETGGLVALRPESSERYGGLSAWIAQAAADVGSYIRHQYQLQFESQTPPPPGEWRELRVRVSALHERVRARSGYVR